MRTKPFLFASTLAVVLCLAAAAPAKAQFYTGGSSVVVGEPVLAPSIVSPYSYVVPTTRYVVPTTRYVVPTTRYVVPTSRVIVQPAPMIMTQPYTVYRPGWGPRPYGVYGPRLYGRRGWW